jgi:hypothetical protein
MLRSLAPALASAASNSLAAAGTAWPLRRLASAAAAGMPDGLGASLAGAAGSSPAADLQQAAGLHTSSAAAAHTGGLPGLGGYLGTGATPPDTMDSSATPTYLVTGAAAAGAPAAAAPGAHWTLQPHGRPTPTHQLHANGFQCVPCRCLRPDRT